ncbi:KH domain-containing protein [Verticillium alfalfae VaMs.102]|uniref:KH domain-containing protein n=1 Tax=Verticillium alfalfae (strain VaMs.102 / ATCC MYA-4576 / FGSC 10136) TaxID=526221 RepID=C9S751_VERA1|nr:KH domain-containing protein [Verticillium alfalfae VaMs.102]EEY14636.1 KH domain-containing protein [Verticillium alfalfae VaMs.102]
MNKLANMRHWSERMSPNFGMGRPNMPVNPMNPRRDTMSQQAASIAMQQPLDAPSPIVHYAFNVPFASDLAGPNTEDILHSTKDAVMRWTHSVDAPDDVQVHELPVHTQNLAHLRKTCKDITNGPFSIEAHVVSTTPKNAKGSQVTTVCLSGSQEMVQKTREMILNDNQTFLRCTTVDVEGELVCDLAAATPVLKPQVMTTLDGISEYCGVDIFLLGPKLTPVVDGMTGDAEMRRDQRWRVAIYGDILSVDHAKTRVLIHIDTLLGRLVDALKLDMTLHQVVCGRQRKNIKLIESSTGTAIYFPSPFSQMYRYCPPNAKRRDPNDILITGETPQAIELAKQKIHETVTRTRLYMKDVNIPAAKIDSVLLNRMDKVRKILEANGTYVLFPVLATGKNMVRVQGNEGLHVERTVREIMSLAGQFYSASWFLLAPEGHQMPPQARQLPSPTDICTMIGDVCANSDADVSFDNNFQMTGSDDAVKTALMVMSDMRFLVQGNHQLRVKIELANEHREFVSGKKNGKINKIMSQSNVTIIFDGFNDYNFNIDVGAASYDAMKQGLALVEQEMPASISFHVPDQYHKRIIGIGGQHIQSIMKKHSVFVKFSNAMDRGGMGREDDDIKVDNVICRTPARNAQNLDAVKNEILEMVDRADSEYTSQIVNVDRLYHRQLLARLAEIDELESKYNCKIVFPSTEQASDEVTVNGPQWQVPHCVDEFLGMVPDNHELVLTRTPGLVKFLESPAFVRDLVSKLKNQYEVEVSVHQDSEELAPDGSSALALRWTFTRNNAGGLGDAVDFMLAELTGAGVEVTILKGSIPRPKSDSFEDSLQYFDSKLLQHAPAPIAADSPVKAAFEGEVARERSTIFDKLRKPGSMTSISSFLDRRKNSSHSNHANFFKGSSNVSKSSLISIESTRSFNADRNPWNDSGVNLNEEDHPWAHRPLGNGTDKLTPVPHPGDVTPRHSTRASGDSGRPSTSHSTNSGYPGPVGPFR